MGSRKDVGTHWQVGGYDPVPVCSRCAPLLWCLSPTPYLLGQLPPPLLASLVPALQVPLVLRLESLHSHLQAQLGILGRRQLVLQFRHLCAQVTGRLFCHPAGSFQLVHLGGGRGSEDGVPREGKGDPSQSGGG